MIPTFNLIKKRRIVFDTLANPKEWKNAGVAGERIVYLQLTKFGVPENQIFRNVYLRSKRGRLTEIDLIAVSKRAVFVFEAKNYGGTISGDGKRRDWTQRIGKQKHYLLNPFLQNRHHVKVLKHVLRDMGVEGVETIPITVFTDRATWNIKNLDKGDIVIREGNFQKGFQMVYDRFEDSLINSEDFNKISELLRNSERPDNAVVKEHRAGLKQRKLG